MEEIYYYWLHNVPGIGRQTYQKLLQYVTPKELYEGGGEKVKHLLRENQKENIVDSIKNYNISKEWEILQKRKIEVLGLLEKTYPEKLSQINDPPPVLYCNGKFIVTSVPMVMVATTFWLGPS